MKAAAKARKESAAKTRKLAAKAPASVECIASGVKKNNLRGLIIKSVCLAAFSTVVAVVVSTAIKRAAVQRGATDRNAEAVTGDLPDAALNTDYEKASLASWKKRCSRSKISSRSDCCHRKFQK